MFESQITTGITVNITFQEMVGGLGMSSTFYGTISYSQYLAALQAHSSGDAVDTSALATLPAGPNNPVNGSTSVDVTTANLRALGFNASIATDSTISINTAITNYSGQPFNSSFYDLEAVVEHETDEALGLGSNLDTGSTTGDIRPEDLFRYAAPGVRSYTTSNLATSYFSINGGATHLIGFNQVGGGSDYGDWVTSGAFHVQDAFGTPGATPVYGEEGTALDAIGYNLVQTSIPEPSTVWLATLGALGFIAGRRARKGPLSASSSCARYSGVHPGPEPAYRERHSRLLDRAGCRTLLVAAGEQEDFRRIFVSRTETGRREAGPIQKPLPFVSCRAPKSLTVDSGGGA